MDYTESKTGDVKTLTASTAHAHMQRPLRTHTCKIKCIFYTFYNMKFKTISRYVMTEFLFLYLKFLTHP